jgi:hypothetical protein
MLILKGSFSFINFPVTMNFANPSPCSGQVHPLPHFPKPIIPSFRYSNIPIVPTRHLPTMLRNVRRAGAKRTKFLFLQ